MAAGKMYRVYKKNTYVPKSRSKLTGPQRRQVKALIKAPMELKYQEGTITDDFGIPSTGATYQLSIIAQGDTDTERDGDQLTLSSVNIRGRVLVGDTTNIVRIIFYQWRPITSPTIPDILSPGVDATNIDIFSLYNHDKRSQFKILSDKTYVLAGFGTSASPYGPASEKYFTMTLNKKLIKKLQYNNGSSTVGSNQVWYLAISDSQATPNPTLSMKVRFNFYDN